MKIKILSFEPRLAPDNTPDSFQVSGNTLYPYVITYTSNGQQYRGEAYVMNTPPWWEIGAIYDVTITPDSNRIGGQKITIARPPQQHTGGTPYPPSNTSQTSSPQYPQTLTTTTTKDDFRQALIVSQTSMKVASEYIPTLTEEEKNYLMEKLGTQEDIISNFAKKIAHETYNLANQLIKEQNPPF